MSGRRTWRAGLPVGPLVECLERGGILVVPTESSYGLAVDPRDARGVAAIFALKGRGAEKALPVVISGTEQLAALGIDREDPAVRCLGHLWPAPLSLVLPLAAPLPAAAETLAVRVPELPLLRRLCAVLGPLTATSANRAGEPPVLSPGAAAELVADVDALVIDGGVLPGGAPSTLVRLAAGELAVLREGRFPVARLRAAVEAAAAAGAATEAR